MALARPALRAEEGEVLVTCTPLRRVVCVLSRKEKTMGQQPPALCGTKGPLATTPSPPHCHTSPESLEIFSWGCCDSLHMSPFLRHTFSHPAMIIILLKGI